MSLRTQILRLIVFSLICVMIALALHYFLYKKRLEVHHSNENTRHEISIITALNILSEDLIKLTFDYSYWDELAQFTLKQNKDWADDNIAGSMYRYGLDYSWVYNDNGQQIFSYSKNEIPDLEAPMPSYAFHTLFDSIKSGKEAVHFFTTIQKMVVEISGSAIHYGSYPKANGEATGFLFFGRIVDDAYLEKLGKLSQSNTEVKPIVYGTAEEKETRTDRKTDTDISKNSIHKMVGNWNHIPAAEFVFSYQDSYEENEERLIKFTLLIYIIVVIALCLLFYGWVIRKIFIPVNKFNKALNEGSPEPIKNLISGEGEFGKLALITERFFSQRKEIIEEIEVRRETQRILKESEDRFRSLSESAFEGIVIHINRRILDVNSALLAMTGYTIEEITWKYFGMMLVVPGQEKLIEDCLDCVSNHVTEFIARRKDGSQFPVEARTRQISFKGKPAYVTTLVDISERIQREEEVRILSRAVESNPASIIITNEKGLIEYVNLKFLDTTGYLKNEVIGKTPGILRSGKHPPAFYKTLWDTILSGQEWNSEICNRKKNGELYWEQASISPIRSGAKITHFVAIKENITDKRRTDEDLQLKNTILTSSITYAKRIQEAVMPDDHILKSLFDGYYTLYLPKDIVSGDFIWMKHIKNILYIVVADCTGHGVPGALMSMLGISLLNERINTSRLDPPDEILNYLRFKIKQAMHQTGTFEEMKEGMDMSLCVIDLESLKMKFSGAFQSISVIRDGKPSLFNGDRQPIGVHYEEKDFTCHSIQLQKGDTLYLYTDGFATQIGGPREKKISTANFRSVLLQASALPFEEQPLYLQNFLDSWRADWEQIDDITVTAMKF
ncbi:MAG: PAS domain S-box protein [Bacteroidales bacterium]